MAFPRFSCAAKAVAMTLALAAPLSLSTTFAHAEAGKAFEANDPVKVIIDKAKVVRIAKAADTIIIGNPSIVDATIQDARTLVLTGRNFGITNLIVLDSDGDVVVDETVLVQSHEHNMVRIYRQSDRETLTCSPVCEHTLSIGDEDKKFTAVNSQMTARDSKASGN